MNTGRFVDPEEVRKLYEKGYSDYRIARELGFRKITILNFTSSNIKTGYSCPSPHSRSNKKFFNREIMPEPD